MTQHKIDFKSLPWISPAQGIRQKTYKDGCHQLRLVEYSKEMPPHWCEKGHIGYILKGKMEIKFQNEVCQYSAGDGVFIPRGQNHKHSVKTLTDKVTVIFVEDI